MTNWKEEIKAEVEGMGVEGTGTAMRRGKKIGIRKTGKGSGNNVA
jgi:hypothetical protein